MSLHFGICWIEDQASDAEVERIETAVRSSGFEPLIERIEKPEDIRAFADRQNHHQDFDLILLDLNLGAGLRGEKLAQQVRAAFRSTTILFYSAEDESRLRERMAQERVEGVYCIHRDRLAARVGELVSHLSPALNRLSSMRGLAARIVAECDADFRAILNHLGQGGEADNIAESLRQRVKSSIAAQQVTVDELASLDDLLASHSVHSAALFNEVKDRARLQGGDDLLVIVRKLHKGFLNQVINRRNTLAHALEERTDAGWQIVRSTGDPVTVADFPRYRAEFQTQLEMVRRLRAILINK
jgi:DNA-binding NarL/FixJ family response regulator